MVSHLLPAADEAPACADFARTLGVRPAGSGLRLDRVVLVPVAEPWPKPALGHRVLKPAAQALAGATAPSRLLAAAPWEPGPPTAEIYELAPTGMVRLTVDLGAPGAELDPARVQEVATRLAATPVGALADLATHGQTIEPVDGPVLAVCTQGSHDACCGRFGVELADAIDRRDDVASRRVSHIGGHRFAPTLIDLASARMWAYVDMDLVERLAVGRVTGPDYGERCRGWLGAATGPPQAAEVSVRAHLAAAHSDAERARGQVIELGPNNRYRVTVGGADYDVDVTALGQVPTIKCQAQGGLPAKTSTQYRATVRAVEQPEWRHEGVA